MSLKRTRSINWDEEEKQLFRSILKDYATIIENKSLDNHSNKQKCKAWEEVHKKFNELNRRPRQLSHLKIQWKAMKINARKAYNTLKQEAMKTGGGARPTTPNDMDVIIEIIDLLNPAELLRDHNIYDSDGIETQLTDNVAIIPVPVQETLQNDVMQQNQNIAEHIATIESDDKDVNDQADVQKVMAEPVIAQDSTVTVTPIRKYLDPMSAKTKGRRKIVPKVIAEPGSKSGKDNYVKSMVSHSRMLKDEEHRRRMEMTEEEHAIKMAIHHEKLKSAIELHALEKEILQLKKLREENNI